MPCSLAPPWPRSTGSSTPRDWRAGPAGQHDLPPQRIHLDSVRSPLDFGYLNAVLGPALPYLRSVEGISYLVGALHQVAYAIGGGIAGALSTRDRLPFSRRSVVAVGLAGAGLAALAVGYGNAAPIMIAGALLMGMLGTLALIRLCAALADARGPRRAVALSEGEVAASLAGIATPLLIGTLAARPSGGWPLRSAPRRSRSR